MNTSDTLRRLAASQLKDEKSGGTLQPTALVHEAYLKLAHATWDSKGHFFVSAARTMRRILIDHARSKQTEKRGNMFKRLDGILLEGIEQPLVNPEFLELEEALQDLAKIDATKATLVELKFFAGLTISQIAEVLGRSEATVKRDWAFARAWLRDKMSKFSEES